MAKFSESLDRRLEEVERPANPPIGFYSFQITKHPEVDEFESAAGDPFTRVTFQCKAIEAQEDVDEDDLAEFGDVSGFPCRKVFLFNEAEGKERDFDNSEFQMKQFMMNAGADENASRGEAMAACVNGIFLGELRHRADKYDPDIVYTEIGKTTAQ